MTLTIYHWKFTNKALLFFFTELFVYGLCVYVIILLLCEFII